VFRAIRSVSRVEKKFEARQIQNKLFTVDIKSSCWKFDDMFKSWLISAMGALERLTRQPRPHGSALLWPEFSVVYQPLQQASLREQFPGQYTAIDK
jgi:hypothetical protein